MPNNHRCCPECGATDFSWITEYIERGHIVDDGSGPGYLEPTGMTEPTGTDIDRGVDCDHCGRRWDLTDLISQDDAYHDPELSARWMMEYEPAEPLQHTLSEE